MRRPTSWNESQGSCANPPSAGRRAASEAPIGAASQATGLGSGHWASAARGKGLEPSLRAVSCREQKARPSSANARSSTTRRRRTTSRALIARRCVAAGAPAPGSTRHAATSTAGRTIGVVLKKAMRPRNAGARIEHEHDRQDEDRHRRRASSRAPSARALRRTICRRCRRSLACAGRIPAERRPELVRREHGVGERDRVVAADASRRSCE